MMRNKEQRGVSRPVLIVIIATLVALGGSTFYTLTRKPAPAEENVDTMAEESAIMKEADDAMADDTMMDDTKGMEGELQGDGAFSGNLLAGSLTTSPLLDYTKPDYDKALASEKLVVLYFYANWCPICKAEFPKMQEAFNQLTGSDVVGFRVNFNDNQTDGDETSLAKQFGVAYQHTKVFIKNGERVLKAPDSWETARYLSEIAKNR